MAEEFEKIFSKNIIHIAFGEDISDKKYEFQARKSKDGTETEPKMLSIRECLHELNE